MKKEISTPIIVVVIVLLVVGAFFVFQKATGPIASESPSPDVTKMSNEEIAKIRQGANPDGMH